MVIGLGNALTDILVRVPDERILGELGVERGGMYLIDGDLHQRLLTQIAPLEQKLVAGGSAANAVSGVAALGTRARYIGHIGADDTGRAFLENQRQHGVESLLGVSDGTPSGKCISIVLPDGERTMLTYLGAAVELDTRHLTPENLSGDAVLFVEGYLLNSPHIIEPAMQCARRAGARIALDAAAFTVIDAFKPYAEQLIAEYVDILFANEDEARSLTGFSAPTAALEALSSGCRTVVVKVGAQGSLVAHGDERHRIGTIPATPLDKTGAGDLYAAGFLHGLVRGLNIKQCGDIGAIVSSKSIETMGGQVPSGVWPQIKRLVAEVEAGTFSI